MNIVVGCPVRARDWIIREWFFYLEAALAVAGFQPEDVTVVHVGDASNEANTVLLDRLWAQEYGWTCHFVNVMEEKSDDERVWNLPRYQHMVALRNLLLHQVRVIEPMFFWSLDSDILTHPSSLASAIDAIDTYNYDAVGLRCYMTPTGTWCPSNAQQNNGGLLRNDGDGVFPVEVIMASKVMTLKAYLVDYELHSQGEDLGWSHAARAAGCKLGWDGRTVSKHVMSPYYLDKVDERCGY